MCLALRFWADLPDEDTQAICVVVPPIRLNLGVLAQHVETQALGHLQVVDQGLVCGGRVDAVWPVTLRSSILRSGDFDILPALAVQAVSIRQG